MFTSSFLQAKFAAAKLKAVRVVATCASGHTKTYSWLFLLFWAVLPRRLPSRTRIRADPIQSHICPRKPSSGQSGSIPTERSLLNTSPRPSTANERWTPSRVGLGWELSCKVLGGLCPTTKVGISIEESMDAATTSLRAMRPISLVNATRGFGYNTNDKLAWFAWLVILLGSSVANNWERSPFSAAWSDSSMKGSITAE